jgi:hypothetical protein
MIVKSSGVPLLPTRARYCVDVASDLGFSDMAEMR